jgi:glyceraldehyde 3-phosphate dehydrogenase
MKTVAINGLGRIGQQFFTIAQLRKCKWNFIINHPHSLDEIVYSLKYDSIHPEISNIKHDGINLIVKGKKIKVYSERDPLKLPWKKEKVDLVIESTGAFTKNNDALKHINAGAKRVLVSAPTEDADSTVAFGINNKSFSKKNKLISAASCTTNCLTALVKVIHENFKINNAQFITTHAYTSSQHLIKSEDKKDSRRGREAALNIIPTSSGAAISTVKVFPELYGKLTGYALRVPVVDGSITSLYSNIKKTATIKQINNAFKKEAKKLKGILQYTEDPIVSSDIINNSHSCIFDANLTKISGNLVSVAGWYDNEWGYSNRLVDLAGMILKK